jgi:hypothetical protein
VADRRALLVTTSILAVGLIAALVIYVAAARAPDDSSAELTDSKQYLRQMELYGGKANLLAAELLQWFASLWHGRRLALTVACGTVLVAGAYWLVAAPLPSDRAARVPRDGP